MKKFITLSIISVLVCASFAGCKTKAPANDPAINSVPENVSQVESIPETESEIVSTPETSKESNSDIKSNPTTSQKPSTESKVETPATNSNVETPATNSKVETPATDSKNENPTTKPVLEFTNYSNNAYDVDAVSIKPYHVYWENGKLVAECYVINGRSNNVSNVIVDNLTFANKDGVFASGNFGAINGPLLPPYTNFTWKFVFSGNALSKTNVDLATLDCKYKVNYFNS